MITLYAFGPGFGLEDASPFVLKLHTFLRMTGLDYETRASVSNLQKAPKGKLPFIEDSGRKIADSSLIIDHLTSTYRLTLDDWLTPEQAAEALLVSKCLEEHLYWCLLYSRWVDDAGWQQLNAEFFSTLPLPIRLVLPTIARRGVLKSARGQGISRHSRDQVLEITRQTLGALSVFLGNKIWFMGDQPCALDAVAYGQLAQFYLATSDSDFNVMAQQFTNLRHYCDQMKKQYFSAI